MRSVILAAAGGIVLAGAVEVAWPRLIAEADLARETQAQADLLELEQAQMAYAATLGNTSFTTPYRLATLSEERDGAPPLLPVRFLAGERYGYRFEFEARMSPPALRGAEPTMSGFACRAVPLSGETTASRLVLDSDTPGQVSRASAAR
jgi:hypothetical protein